MIDLLGASTESAVRVFVCFFLGLALGSAAASRFIPRLKRPWRCLAGIELGVALTCIPLLLFPYWTGWVWPALGPERLTSGIGVLVKTCVSFLLLVPPAALMGMTMPVMVSAVCVAGAGWSRETVRLYAVNTLGGVVGLAVVAGIAIQQLGVPGSMILLAVVNTLVAAQCYRRSLAESPAPCTSHAESRESGARESNWYGLTLALAGFSGVGVMALEVPGLQLLELSVPTSFYPPAAIRFCVILLLGTAAWLVPRAVRHFGLPHRVLPLSLTLAGLAIVLVPLILLSFGVARTADAVYSRTFEGFLAKTMGLTLVSLGPAFLFCGLTFPLAVSMCSGTGAVAGRKLGILLAVNGLGGVVGAEVARGVLLPFLGVHVAIGLVGLGYAAAGIAVGIWTKERREAEKERDCWPTSFRWLGLWRRSWRHRIGSRGCRFSTGARNTVSSKLTRDRKAS
jgi:spermidine synthase